MRDLPDQAAAGFTDDEDAALLDLLGVLKAAAYGFVVPTPRTHALVSGRRGHAERGNLRDVFGWVLPFAERDVDRSVLALMRQAGVVRETPHGLVSTVRVGSVDDRLYLHSAPTRDSHAVFLGPDSQRFARLIRQVLADTRGIQAAVDIGVGAGVGAMTVAGLCPQARVIGTDPNPAALRFLRVNARHAGLAVEARLAEGLEGAPRDLDLVVANPPYIAGSGGRLYRDGGDRLGAAITFDWVAQTLPRLRPGGRMILYTGSAIVDGRDLVRQDLERLTHGAGARLDYEEIDPDVFGGTLRQNAYRAVERIAAVGAVITRP